MKLSGLIFLHSDSRKGRIYILPDFKIKIGFELFEQVISQKQTSFSVSLQQHQR